MSDVNLFKRKKMYAPIIHKWEQARTKKHVYPYWMCCFNCLLSWSLYSIWSYCARKFAENIPSNTLLPRLIKSIEGRSKCHIVYHKIGYFVLQLKLHITPKMFKETGYLHTTAGTLFFVQNIPNDQWTIFMWLLHCYCVWKTGEMCIW